jgi:translation elongation factor EF-1alpha
MSIESCYDCNVQSKKGYILAGRVEGGVFKKGEKLVIKPPNLEVTIKDIHIGDKPTHVAYPGDICDMLITLKKDKEWEMIQKGCFLSSIKLHVPTGRIFLAEIKLYDLQDPVLIGTRVNIHLCGFVEGCVFSRLRHVEDPITGEVLKKNPRFLTAGQKAQVEVTVDRDVCLEIYENFKSLGRFQFRYKGKSLGEGRVLRILK